MKTYKDIAEDPKELKLLAETLVEVADKNPSIADMGICLWDVAKVLEAVADKIKK